jgi:hypothetical protein
VGAGGSGADSFFVDAGALELVVRVAGADLVELAGSLLGAELLDSGLELGEGATA